LRRTSGGACTPNSSTTCAPTSPPAATKCVYPRRFISTTQLRAMWGMSQPVTVDLPENPYPGSDGTTISNASDALAPWAVGLVSGSMIFSCSMIEPGHPSVTMSGIAFSCCERMWMVRQVSIADITFNWARLIWPAWRARKAAPWRSKISGTSSGGRIAAQSPGLPPSSNRWNCSSGLVTA
jgi:hypothetical protein